MSNLLEFKKVNSTPTLVTTSDYNSLDHSEKLKCLINVRTAIEKEINWVEKEFGKFVSKRKFS